MEKIKVGDIVIAKITDVKPYAAFLSFEDGSRGLLHISEISDKFIKDIDSYVSKGDEISVLVLSIDDTDHFIRTSFKKIPEQERHTSHVNERVKPLVNDEDFAPLKERLEGWIKESLEEKEKNKV